MKKIRKFTICVIQILLLIINPAGVFAEEPNEMGEVLIIMYHALKPYPPKENYMCSIAQFKSDMQKLYDNGYRLISIADLLDNNIRVEKGCSPVVLTFDDGYDTSFSLVEKDGKLVPKPDCAVDIINKFNQEHPDFGQAGVFFICDYEGMEPFRGAGTLKERLEYLVSMGYELGNHTGSHAALNRLNASGIMKEMAGVEKLVGETLPGYKMRCAAYPYGYLPDKKYKEALLSGEHDGVKYEYEIVMRERMTETSALPYSCGFDKFNFPRVRGSDNSEEDLGWFIKHYGKNGGKRYVSDGDAEVITVPASRADKINIWKCLDKVIKVTE